MNRRKIRLWEIPWDDISRITFFQTDSGSLFVIELADSDVMQCQSFASFVRYCLKNRRKVFFFPVKDQQEKDALEFFELFFNGTIRRKHELTHTFPLFRKRQPRGSV